MPEIVVWVIAIYLSTAFAKFFLDVFGSHHIVRAMMERCIRDGYTEDQLPSRTQMYFVVWLGLLMDSGLTWWRTLKGVGIVKFVQPVSVEQARRMFNLPPLTEQTE